MAGIDDHESVGDWGFADAILYPIGEVDELGRILRVDLPGKGLGFHKLQPGVMRGMAQGVALRRQWRRRSAGVMAVAAQFGMVRWGGTAGLEAGAEPGQRQQGPDVAVEMVVNHKAGGQLRPLETALAGLRHPVDARPFQVAPEIPCR